MKANCKKKFRFLLIWLIFIIDYSLFRQYIWADENNNIFENIRIFKKKFVNTIQNWSICNLKKKHDKVERKMQTHKNGLRSYNFFYYFQIFWYFFTFLKRKRVRVFWLQSPNSLNLLSTSSSISRIR